MKTLMERGMAMLNRVAPKAAGGTIIYRRGSEAVAIEATFGESEFAVESADSVRLEHTDRDFIFAADCLILGGTLATPQTGDRIEVVKSGQTFDAFPANGKKCFALHGPNGEMIRVFAKRVGT